MCLECMDNATENAETGNTVDFCTLQCSQTSVHPKPLAVKAPHMPEHNLLKATTNINPYRDLARVHREGNRAVYLLRQSAYMLEASGKQLRISQEKVVSSVADRDTDHLTQRKLSRNHDAQMSLVALTLCTDNPFHRVREVRNLPRSCHSPMLVLCPMFAARSVVEIVALKLSTHDWCREKPPILLMR